MTRRDGEPRFEVIVVVYRGRPMLESFLAHLGTGVPITVVDNSAEEEDLGDLLGRYPNVRHVDSGGNLGYSAAANLGAQRSEAEYLVFMNPDTAPTEEAVAALVDYLEEHRDVAACGAAGVHSSGGGAQPTLLRMLVHSAGLHRLWPQAGVFFNPAAGEVAEAGWISGSCLAISRREFEEVGGWNPDFFIYMSDFDLGLRIGRRGRRQVVLGDVVIPHDDGGSSDVPHTWTWERRGSAWVRFFRAHHRPLVMHAALSILSLGYVARYLLYAVTRRRMRKLEMATYLRSMLRAWMRPGETG